jgi:hypothetical protein
MLIVRSQRGIPIRLTDERWEHIIRRHPEVLGLRDAVLETVSDPDMIQEGDFGELLAIRGLSGIGKSVVVVYREGNEDSGFVLTAYVTSRPSARRRIKWKR